MKLIIFAGTPGSGKTSLIRHVIDELKDEFKIVFAKFDCLHSIDSKKIEQECRVPTITKLAGDICPDHYAALELPRILKQNRDKDIIILETAGLCLRCSPYVKEGLGVSVLDIISGEPSRYGPVLAQADVVAISKGDLISQAEREIFGVQVSRVNPRAKVLEVNGLTGEGACDVVGLIKASLNIDGKRLTLRHSMPSAICGYCYGNITVDAEEARKRFLVAKGIKALLPNMNCQRCGFRTCNEFIRAVLDGKVVRGKCPFI